MQHGEFDVIISGAGPAGLSLAIDLGQRGVRVLLLERNAEPGPWPKMERTNPRSMEYFRRLGVAEEIRAVGYPATTSMDIIVGTTLADPPIVRLPFPTVHQFREKIAACTDGTQPLEPYQLVSQYALEPVLKKRVETTDGVEVLFGHETVAFTEDASGVTVTAVAASDGSEHTFRARFLVGCDGGSSMVRKSLGINLRGEGRIRQLTQVQFRSDGLYERMPIGQGRHYLLADGQTIVVQGNLVHFTLHTELPIETDFVPVIRDLIGFDVEFEILRATSWTHNLLVADHYRDRHVFIAGDAAHLVIPNGGLGMNTAVGDVMDLSWILAGVVAGWAGEDLLDAYEAERRPVALFNRTASRWATENLSTWKQLVTPVVFQRGPEGEEARAGLAEVAGPATLLAYSMRGAELGYNYWASPVILSEAERPAWEIIEYVPSSEPGSSLPHVWLSDGRAIADAVGKGFTYISLVGGVAEPSLEAEFARLGAPLDVLLLEDPLAAKILQTTYLLVRPDLHIVWRGHTPPDNPGALARLATGHIGVLSNHSASDLAASLRV